MKKNLFIAFAAMLVLVACSNGAKKQATKCEAKKEMCTKAGDSCCEKKAKCEKEKPSCGETPKCDKKKECGEKKPCCATKE